MTIESIDYILPVSEATQMSSARVMTDLCAGQYLEHFLTNAARPFVEKQAAYLSSYERSVRSLNHRYVMECRGEHE